MNKKSWPEFPLWWLEQSRRNMSCLQDIAAHLHEKTETYRHHPSGVCGETNDVEKQIVEHIGNLRQQVGALTDVVPALLQIIGEDHWRRTHKVERLFAWIREKGNKIERALKRSVFYRILAIASTLGLLLALAKFLVHIMWGK